MTDGLHQDSTLQDRKCCWHDLNRFLKGVVDADASRVEAGEHGQTYNHSINREVHGFTRPP